MLDVATVVKAGPVPMLPQPAYAKDWPGDVQHLTVDRGILTLVALEMNLLGAAMAQRCPIRRPVVVVSGARRDGNVREVVWAKACDRTSKSLREGNAFGRHKSS